MSGREVVEKKVTRHDDFCRSRVHFGDFNFFKSTAGGGLQDSNFSLR